MIRFLTAGESHGQALVGIIEGMPAGLPLNKQDIQSELIRRKQGYGRGDRQKIENENLEILSGVRGGKTLGSPISILLPNQDWDNWKDTMAVEAGKPVDREVDIPRPGHADLPGALKYGHKDIRNVLERSSARETAMRVALGAVAKRLLAELGVGIQSRVCEIGGETDEARWVSKIDRAREAGDTLGGIFEVRAQGLPVGLGSYVQWDRRLEGALAQALMSLNAIKGVEVGMGLESARRSGREVHDEMQARGYLTNRSGGINGGMTTGEPLIVRAAMKPLSTLQAPLRSFSLSTGEAAAAHYERSDVCAVWSAAVIGESLVALVLANSMLEKFGGDSVDELRERVEGWKRKTSI
jgi:chorismate synthase